MKIIIFITVVLLTIITAYSETETQIIAHNEFLEALLRYNSAVEICQPQDFQCQRRQLSLESAVDMKAKKLVWLYPTCDLAPLARAWTIATQDHSWYLAVWHNQPLAEMDEVRQKQMAEALMKMSTSWEILRAELQKISNARQTGSKL